MMDLTILMPCRNEEAAVGQCIDDARSFLARYALDGEILVVDNGSADRSAQIAAIGLGNVRASGRVNHRSALWAASEALNGRASGRVKHRSVA